MRPINSLREADEAASCAFQLEDDGRHAEALNLWKAIACFDPEYDHAMALAKLAEYFEMQSDWGHADHAHRLAIMLDPDDYGKITNYAAFLIDLKKYREAYTLLKPINDGSGPATYDNAKILLRDIESAVGQDLPSLWNYEPLDPDSITKATAEGLERFLQDL